MGDGGTQAALLTGASLSIPGAVRATVRRPPFPRCHPRPSVCSSFP